MAGSTCGTGLGCTSTNLCLPEGTGSAPSEPKCYTSCNANLTEEDGTFRACPSDGLMAGCVGTSVCTDGSCVPPGGTVRSCSLDVECPDHQACIDSRCYSNCDTNAQCDEEESCYRHVCRARCSSSAGMPATCAAGRTCLSLDGENGVCFPSSAPTGTPVTDVRGAFELSRSILEFSNTKVSTTFKLINGSPAFERFTIRKLSHEITREDGDIDRVEYSPSDAGPEACGSNCPLYWLNIGPAGGTMQAQEVVVGVDGNEGEVALEVGNASGANAVRWRGTIEISHPQMGAHVVQISYAEKPEGQWSGNIYYFASFGDRDLEPWMASQQSRANATLQGRVGNALIQRWIGFRIGRIGWDEFSAVLSSTKTGQWNFESVRQAEPCRGDPNKACYLYDINAAGATEYTSSLRSFPIPTGVTEMPVALNLRQPDVDATPNLISGRIESARTLHYAGNPAVDIELVNSPDACVTNTFGECVNFLASFDADIYVGGRYLSTKEDPDCTRNRADGTFEQRSLPWLVPGFQRLTDLDTTTGLRSRRECRDQDLPFQSADPMELLANQARNVSLAGSNPVPDGRTRRRSIRLVDGAMINSTQMFVIFQERFDSFLDSTDADGGMAPDAGAMTDADGFAAYGYMLLERDRTDIPEEDRNENMVPDAYEGSRPTDTRIEPRGVLNAQCSPDVLQKLFITPATVLPANKAADSAMTLIQGVPGNTAAAITGSEVAHYLCADTGLIDGGKGNSTPHGQLTALSPNTNVCASANNNICEDGAWNSTAATCSFATDTADCGSRTDDDRDARVTCPVGSEVLFFSVNNNSITQTQIANLPCQQNGTCLQTLNAWKDSPTPLIQHSLVWRCTSNTRVLCDDNRKDLRDGKNFYAASTTAPRMVPIWAEIDSAFRYKTRFKSRTTGQTAGFAPQLCVPGSNLVPYCYDPAAIEAIRGRVDCLLDIWKNHHDTLDTVTQAPVLNRFLIDNFSENIEVQGETRTIREGFEKLYAELLIMQGDEAFTAAFASRFDLAGSRTSGFEGSRFETNGMHLSGVAGFEMVSLYKAGQYYQEALDRFYSLSPLLWKALSYGATERNFYTSKAITLYVDRLIRASTQRTRVWSEVAKRYQSFNRPDLARTVVERAYTGAYLEGIILSRMMLKVLDVTSPQEFDQIRKAVEDAQRRYRVALLDMRDVYSSITDDVTLFDLAPDYIPLPALDAQSLNAVDVTLLRAQERMRMASEREDEALQSSRSFETDAAQFQSELTRIRTTYETQLSELCGTFKAADNRIYPAITRYAELDPRARLMGDPCGLMGLGRIHEESAQMEIMEVDIRSLMAQYSNVFAEVDIEKARVLQQCNLTNTIANYVYNKQGEIGDLRDEINISRNVISSLDRTLSTVQTIAQLTKCSLIVGVAAGGDCPAAVGASIAFSIATAALSAASIGVEASIVVKEREIAQLDRESGRWQTQQQCSQATIDSNARTATSLLRLKELDLEMVKTQRRVGVQISIINKLRNEATRLAMEQADVEQLAINVEAARNDPNVRIYKNDAIINADFSFDDAMREAYRATRVFEYYTSQSYAAKEKLFLIRMISRGEYNLENYLVELQNDFREFQETYGNPDTRVAILSLRDDILAIPRSKAEGTGSVAMDQSERVEQFRAALTDVKRLDENGYLAFPFSTSLDFLSPLTRNHKVLYVEAELVGSDVGDTLGRIYLRQQGTSVVRALAGDKQFMRMPERTAVLNPFFNGVRVFTPDVYRSYRLRDRPLVNTAWELVLNQRDERVNQDVNLQSLTDVRLYVYYTDFTAL